MFNIKGYKYTYLLIILLVFTNFCGENAAVQKIKEGEIEYEINYLDSERENPLISLLPRKMITVFKDNSSYSLIEGFWGTFKLVHITNHLGQNVTLFQILDKKYMYLADTAATPLGYPAGSDVKLSFSKKEKYIAGYKCNHANAVFSNSNDTVDVYYTDQFEIKNPNSNNPYRDVNGVLLEFSVKMAGINMMFKAKRIIGGKIDSGKFVIPTGYKEVSREEMEKIICEYNRTADK
ncbi:MAG: hypothetical protein ABFS35_03355 [Bacteroidota bacterium]